MITVEMRFDYDTKTHRLYTTDNIRAPTDIARVSLDVCERLGLTKGGVTLVFMREQTDIEGLALVSEMKRIHRDGGAGGRSAASMCRWRLPVWSTAWRSERAG